MAVNPSDSAARVGSRKLRCSSPRRAGACSAGVSEPATRAHSSIQLGHGRLAARPDVEHPALVSERRDRRAGDVADVHVVARLPAVAEDPRLLAAREGAEKDRDDARLAMWILSRPVHVPVAQRDVPRPVEPVVRAQVLLGGQLRRAVRRERLARRVLASRFARTRRRSRRRWRRRPPAPRASVPPRGCEPCRGRSHPRPRPDARRTRARPPAPRDGRPPPAGRRRRGRRAARGCRARASSAPAATLSSLPWTSESTTATSAPCATSASTTCEPMNPAPPVTIARTDASYGRP